MSDEEPFLAAIAAAPADDAPRLVFADWLEERGDPRGVWLRDPVIAPHMGVRCENPIPQLTNRLGEGEHGPLIDALTRIGAPAIPTLLTALRTRPDYARPSVALVLNFLASDLAAFRPQLEEEAKSPDPDIRSAALTALACLRDAAGRGPLLERLESTDPATRAAALQVISTLGSEAIPFLPHILRLWRREADARSGIDFRREAIPALGRVGRFSVEPVPPLLVGALAHPALAPLVPDALEGFGQDDVGPPLLQAIGALDPTGARLAIEALGRTHDAADVLLAAALDRDETTDRTRLAILGAVADGVIRLFGRTRPLVDAVTAQLAHDTPAVRRAAIAAVGALGGPAETALPALDRAARDRDPRVRAAAVGAAVRVGQSGDRSRALLRRALTDDEPAVRAAAWDGYLVINAFPLLIRDLRELIRHDDPGYRACAAETLGRVLAYEVNWGDDRVTKARAAAVSLLVETLGDESRAVRKAVVSVLADHLPQETEEAVEPLVKALGDSSAVVREKAALAFSRLEWRTEPAVRACLRLLNDEDVGVICSALTALGVMRKERDDIDRRITPFLRDRSARVRAAAGLALTTWWGPSDDALDDARDLADDRDPAARAAGLRLLAAFTSDVLGEKIVKYLRRGLADSVVEVRRAAAEGVKRIPSEVSAPLAPDLTRLLESETDEGVRTIAAEYLKYSCPAKADVLGPLLGHPSPAIRARALDALAGAGPSAAPYVGKLLAEFERDMPETRLPALNALVGIGPAAEPAVPALIRILETGVPDDVYVATGVAGTLGPAGAPLVPILDAIRRDPDAYGGAGAVSAIASLSPHCPAAVPIIHEILRDPESPHVRTALIALSEVGAGAEPFVSDLLPLLARDAEIARAATWVAAKVGPAAAPAVPALTELLGPAREWHVREAAADALGAIGPAAAAAVPALRRVCEGTEEGSQFDQIRRHAMEALGKIGSADALPQIRKALFGDDEWGREEAAQALIPLGPAARPALADVCRALMDRKWDRCRDILTEAGFDRRMYLLDAVEAMKTTADPLLPTLQKALDDPNVALRERAAEVLAGLGPEAHPVLKRAVKHKDESIREIARKALGM